MTRIFASFYCGRCGQIRRFTKRCLDSRRYLVATILTGGLWGIVWWYQRQREKNRPWRCSICGTLQMPREEPPEAKALREQRKSGPMQPISPRRTA